MNNDTVGLIAIALIVTTAFWLGAPEDSIRLAENAMVGLFGYIKGKG